MGAQGERAATLRRESGHGLPPLNRGQRRYRQFNAHDIRAGSALQDWEKVLRRERCNR